jgi:hypothetical protein
MVSAAMSGLDMFSVVVKYNTINFDGKLFFHREHRHSFPRRSAGHLEIPAVQY